MTIHAVLFDLDNTLYPASSGLMHALDTRILDYVGNLLGVSLPEAQAIRRSYFLTYGTTLRGLQIHHNVDTEHYLAQVHDLAFDAFLDSDAELDHLLGQVSAKKAIFTNAPAEHASRVLRILGIERHFSQIFDIRFQQFLPKPHELGYRRALDALGYAPAETVMVEDTLINLDTARRLGITTIFVGDEPAAEHPADYVVADVLAALRIILELQGPEH